jgi:hypothetical protein
MMGSSIDLSINLDLIYLELNSRFKSNYLYAKFLIIFIHENIHNSIRVLIFNDIVRKLENIELDR